MENRDLQELPKFEDRWSFVYFDKGIIHQHHKSIACFCEDKIVPIPVEMINLIMLGPGTSISHESIKRIGEARCLIAWTGEESVRFYASGYAGTYSARNLLQQVEQYGNEERRMITVRRMYQKRFPGQLPDGLSIEQLRGKEGMRVRGAYERLSKEYNVEWKGRKYDQGNWDNADPLNRALSAANSTLYGIVHAAILASGFSPAIGFIHTGKQLSFVYDIADLYKIEITVPCAFQCVAEGCENLEREVRLRLRDLFRETKIIKRIIPDIKEVLFGNTDCGASNSGFEGRDVAVSIGSEAGSFYFDDGSPGEGQTLD